MIREGQWLCCWFLHCPHTTSNWRLHVMYNAKRHVVTSPPIGRPPPNLILSANRSTAWKRGIETGLKQLTTRISGSSRGCVILFWRKVNYLAGDVISHVNQCEGWKNWKTTGLSKWYGVVTSPCRYQAFCTSPVVTLQAVHIPSLLCMPPSCRYLLYCHYFML